MIFVSPSRGLVLGLAVLAVACGGESDDPTQQPDGWSDELAMAAPRDLDPDPHVLEIDLVARVADVPIRSGAPTRLYTYDGTLPGPMLRAREGDRIVVHFRNELPEPTSIHWHGIRIENAMDGAPPHTQLAIEPGASFDYDFVVPDAGTYWYHPHVRSAAQVGAGLFGALIVDPREDDPREAALGDELVVVLSDVSLDVDNQLQPDDAGGDLGTLFGREGTVILANGKYLASVRARPGLRQRWRFINAARARYFQLGFDGLPLTRIGGDAGFLARPVTVPQVLVVPGGRADVVVTPQGPAPRVVPLQWTPFDRGFGSTEFRFPEDVFRVSMRGAPGTISRVPDMSRPVELLSAEGATPVDVELTQGKRPDGSLELGINGVPFEASVPFDASVGETQLWTVTTRMQWSHPFHLHGFFFQEVDEAGVSRGEWSDTADVRHTDGKLRFLVRYDNRPGMWMFHCHLLDHGDAGMMGMIDLRR